MAEAQAQIQAKDQRVSRCKAEHYKHTNGGAVNHVFISATYSFCFISFICKKYVFYNYFIFNFNSTLLIFSAVVFMTKRSHMWCPINHKSHLPNTKYNALALSICAQSPQQTIFTSAQLQMYCMCAISGMASTKTTHSYEPSTTAINLAHIAAEDTWRKSIHNTYKPFCTWSRTTRKPEALPLRMRQNESSHNISILLYVRRVARHGALSALFSTLREMIIVYGEWAPLVLWIQIA